MSDIPNHTLRQRRTLISGAGISGLSAAFDLRDAGREVLVVERRNRVGGAIDTNRVDGCLLEGGADSFLSQKPAAMRLIADAGLAAEVIGSNDHQRITFIKRNGGLEPLPEGMMMMIPTRVWPVLTTGLLGWGDKLRMGLEYFRGPAPAGSPERERSVEEFLLDHFPRAMLDYLAEPLLAGVYGGDPAKMSANAVLPRFVEMERTHGSLVRAAISAPKQSSDSGSLFRTLKGGLGALIDTIAPKDVLLGREIEAVERASDGGWRVRVAGDWIDAANVILTGPAYEAASLIRPFAGRAAELLDGIGYTSSVTVTAGYRASKLATPLKGFGLLVPRVERKRLLAATFLRNKFPHRIPDGWEAIRCFFGGASDEGALRESDETLIQLAREELRELIGLDAEPDFTFVRRWDRAMAQYGIGHAARIAELRTELEKFPGLYIAGNGYQGIGIPDCIETGRAAATRILSVPSV